MTLILYFGNYGTTKKVAYLLANELTDCEVVDGTEKIIDLAAYDKVIIGTNIRMSKPNKKFLKWCKKNKQFLSSHSVSSYIVGADYAKGRKYIEKIVGILSNVKDVVFVGGEFHPELAKGFDRRILLNCIYEYKKRDLDLPSLDENKIHQFALKIKED